MEKSFILKMKVGIIVPDYPSKNDYAFAFVHARAKLYIDKGVKVRAFILSNKKVEEFFEGVSVIRAGKKELLKSIKLYSPDVLAIHYPTYKTIPFIKQINLPKVVWLHGHEILWSLYLRKARSIFDYIKKRFVLIPREAFQIFKIRSLLDEVEFSVFVSNWLLKNAEKTAFKKFKNAVVIPNPVDTNLFSYKKPKNINHGISLRSFSSKIYGLDIAIKAFSKLEDVKLFLYGKGKYFNKYVSLSKKFRSNTIIVEKSFNHNELNKLYYNFGFFVAPSRAETQGLAMCEAMACGLPVIATKVGGIPEFVRDNIDGYLVPLNDPKKLKEAVIKLISNKKKYFEMSQNARQGISKKCSNDVVVKAELLILKNAINQKNKSIE